jgi:4-amino-4-deoxy-L-arabinose transferase-like glycosyltransferase
MIREGGFNLIFSIIPHCILSVYAAHLVAGMLGLTHAITPDNAAWAFSHDVILAGRIVTLCWGAATAPLVFLIGRETSGNTIGLLAGILLALMPLTSSTRTLQRCDARRLFSVALSHVVACAPCAARKH